MQEKLTNFLNAGPLRKSNDLLGMVKIQLSIAKKAQTVNELRTIGSRIQTTGAKDRMLSIIKQSYRADQLESSLKETLSKKQLQRRPHDSKTKIESEKIETSGDDFNDAKR